MLRELADIGSALLGSVPVPRDLHSVKRRAVGSIGGVSLKLVDKKESVVKYDSGLNVRGAYDGRKCYVEQSVVRDYAVAFRVCAVLVYFFGVEYGAE